jgi:predicted acetyltransferase
MSDVSADSAPDRIHPDDAGPQGRRRAVRHVIRALTREDIPEFLSIDQWAFAFDNAQKAAFAKNFADSMDWDHVYGVALADDAPNVGTFGWIPFSLAVPGGDLPCAGVTAVSVHPLHRRKGCLRAMMQHHLTDAVEAGRVVSALFAAETPIYGRFGFGLASQSLRLTIARGAALRPLADSCTSPSLRMEIADQTVHMDELAECYETWRSQRPGTVDKVEQAHRASVFIDPPEYRQGAESLRVLIAEGEQGGPARGYALFRRTQSKEGFVGGTVQVHEFVARDPGAAHTLWSTLVDLDLMGSLRTCPLPVDDPIMHLLVDSRGPKPEVSDNLWVRILDLPAALAGRDYAAPVDTVLEVTDELISSNAGRWHLRGGPQGARCTRTDAPADLSLDVRTLASAYLGGHSLGALAAGGLVNELVPGTLLPASTALGWPVAPFSSWCF